MNEIDVEKMNELALPHSQITDSNRSEINMIIENLMNVYDNYLTTY